MFKSCSAKKGAQKVAIYNSAASLPDYWGQHLQEGHFLQKDCLAAHEATNLPQIKPIYVAIEQNGECLLQAAFQIFEAQGDLLGTQAVKPWQHLLWSIFARTKPQVLVAGQLFRHDIDYCSWRKDIPPYQAYHLLIEAIEAVSQSCRILAVLAKETPASLVPYMLHHAPKYLLLRNDISMHMPIPQQWESLIDYEKSLKHKYAQRYRKIRQSIANIKIVEWDEHATIENATTIFSLYKQVADKQTVKIGTLSEDFIPNLKRYYGNQLKIWAFYEGDTVIAFASAWVQDNSFDMFYIGFDYAKNAEYNLYFNILYFSIEQAILLSKPQLILGRTALDAKARVGCLPEYLHTFVYIRNSLIRGIAMRLQGRLQDSGSEWENRHPFKDSSKEK